MLNTMLTAEQKKIAQNLLSESKRIVITTHQSPDGDAMGSSLGLHIALKNAGIESTVIVPDEIPSFLQWLPKCDQVIVFKTDPEKAKAIFQESDLLFMLDYNHPGRTGKDMAIDIESFSGRVMLIDHHHQPIETPELIYSDTSSCSTAQMIFVFLQSLGMQSCIDNDAAACIYCGIMTDSGSFRFPSVTKQTHDIVGYLIERGLDHARVHREVYDTNLIDRMRLVGYALNEKLTVIEGASTAFISLSTVELKKFNYRPGDTEGLVNQALSLQGINLAAFFREGNNEIKISFRSKGSFDVNAFAREKWNGGGHSNAAGGRAVGNLDDAVKLFVEQVKERKNAIIHS